MEDSIRIKVITLGPADIGKTCILRRIAYDTYEEKTSPTVNVDCFTKTTEENCKKYSVDMWDTAGQERYQALNKTYIRGSDVILVCFDPDEQDVIGKVIKPALEIEPEASIILVATKCDLYSEEKLSRITSDRVMNSLKETYKATDIVTTSASNGEGISALYQIIINAVRNKNITAPSGKPMAKIEEGNPCCKA